MRFFISSLIFLTSIHVNAQIVSIPDANFKSYLVNNMSINTNNDSEIQISEAATYSGVINCPSLNIQSLTGIEAFTALTELKCHNNQLTSLDVSSNTALTWLECTGNSLTVLDLSALSNLDNLRCENNQLTSLDVSNNVLLDAINCSNNQLTSLVLGACDLTYLNCSNNNLSTLDASNKSLSQFFCANNPNLTSLKIENNQLASVDVSTNSNLILIWAARNNLTSIDVSNCAMLEEFYCDDNNLNEIDVSQNTELLRFRCSDNNLNCLNFANGTNSAVQEFWAHNNPNLACIQVDDSIYSAQNWNSIDSQMYFSETCSGDCNQPPLSVSHITKPDKKELVRIIDLLGKETKPEVNTIQVYQYSDGSFEKKVVIE